MKIQTFLGKVREQQHCQIDRHDLSSVKMGHLSQTIHQSTLCDVKNVHHIFQLTSELVKSEPQAGRTVR